MQTVEALFADYASYHQTRGNKIFHRLGIPMIMFSLIGMLTYVPLFDIGTIRIDAAMVLIGLSSAYYFIIEWRLGIAMIAVSIVFYFLSAAIPLAINAIDRVAIPPATRAASVAAQMAVTSQVRRSLRRWSAPR